MQRRAFLYQSGILIPTALFVSPSVWASSQKTGAGMLLITGSSAVKKEKIAAIVQAAAGTMQEIAGDRIRKLSYSGDGFLVATIDGKTYTAAKIVFNSAYEIDTTKLMVEIKTENENLQMNYNSGKNIKRVRPELWAYRSEKFSKEDMLPFIERKKHALMCIS
jgi:hypothetical protein